MVYKSGVHGVSDDGQHRLYDVSTDRREESLFSVSGNRDAKAILPAGEVGGAFCGRILCGYNSGRGFFCDMVNEGKERRFFKSVHIHDSGSVF